MEILTQCKYTRPMTTPNKTLLIDLNEIEQSLTTYACAWTYRKMYIHTSYQNTNNTHILWTFLNTHTHTHTRTHAHVRTHTYKINIWYIYKQTHYYKNTQIHWREVKRGERTKKILNKTTKNLQLIPMGRSQTLNLESSD